MHDEYYKFYYDGPVMMFNTIVINRWRGETMAPTLTKARNNLTYQAKQELKLVGGSKISLPGKIEIIE